MTDSTPLRTPSPPRGRSLDRAHPARQTTPPRVSSPSPTGRRQSQTGVDEASGSAQRPLSSDAGVQQARKHQPQASSQGQQQQEQQQEKREPQIALSHHQTAVNLQAQSPTIIASPGSGAALETGPQGPGGSGGEPPKPPTGGSRLAASGGEEHRRAVTATGRFSSQEEADPFMSGTNRYIVELNTQRNAENSANSAQRSENFATKSKEYSEESKQGAREARQAAADSKSSAVDSKRSSEKSKAFAVGSKKSSQKSEAFAADSQKSSEESAGFAANSQESSEQSRGFAEQSRGYSVNAQQNTNEAIRLVGEATTNMGENTRTAMVAQRSAIRSSRSAAEAENFKKTTKELTEDNEKLTEFNVETQFQITEVHADTQALRARTQAAETRIQELKDDVEAFTKQNAQAQLQVLELHAETQEAEKEAYKSAVESSNFAALASDFNDEAGLAAYQASDFKDDAEELAGQSADSARQSATSAVQSAASAEKSRVCKNDTVYFAGHANRSADDAWRYRNQTYRCGNQAAELLAETLARVNNPNLPLAPAAPAFIQEISNAVVQTGSNNFMRAVLNFCSIEQPESDLPHNNISWSRGAQSFRRGLLESLADRREGLGRFAVPLRTPGYYDNFVPDPHPGGPAGPALPPGDPAGRALDPGEQAGPAPHQAEAEPLADAGGNGAPAAPQQNPDPQPQLELNDGGAPPQEVVEELDPGPEPIEKPERDFMVEFKIPKIRQFFVRWADHSWASSLSFFFESSNKKKQFGLRLNFEEYLVTNVIKPELSNSNGHDPKSWWFTVGKGPHHEVHYRSWKINENKFRRVDYHYLQNTWLKIPGCETNIGGGFGILFGGESTIKKPLKLLQSTYMHGGFDLSVSPKNFLFIRNRARFAMNPLNGFLSSSTPRLVLRASQQVGGDQSRKDSTLVDIKVELEGLRSQLQKHSTRVREDFIDLKDQLPKQYEETLQTNALSLQNNFTEKFQEISEKLEKFEREYQDPIGEVKEQLRAFHSQLSLILDERILAAMNQKLVVINKTLDDKLENLSEKIDVLPEKLSLDDKVENLSEKIDVLPEKLREGLDVCIIPEAEIPAQSENFDSSGDEKNNDVFEGLTSLIGFFLATKAFEWFLIGTGFGLVYISFTEAIVMRRRNNQHPSQEVVLRVIRTTIGMALPFAIAMIFANYAWNLLLKKPLYQKWPIFSWLSFSKYLARTGKTTGLFYIGSLFLLSCVTTGRALFSFFILGQTFLALPMRTQPFFLVKMGFAYLGSSIAIGFYVKFIVNNQDIAKQEEYRKLQAEDHFFSKNFHRPSLVQSVTSGTNFSNVLKWTEKFTFCCSLKKFSDLFLELLVPNQYSFTLILPFDQQIFMATAESDPDSADTLNNIENRNKNENN